MYTIIDLLNKLIDIEKKIHVIYKEMVESEAFSQPIKTMARVLAREKKRNVEKYVYINNELKDKEGIDIDFELYDKVSKAILTFSKRSVDVNLTNTNELLKYAVDFEKENLALVLRIQGILVRRIEDEKTIAYMALTELIQERNMYIKNIERFIL